MTTEAPEKVAAPATTTTTEAPAATALTAEQEAAADAEFGAGFNQAHGEEEPSHAESRPAKEPAKVEPPKVEAKPEKPAPAAPAKTAVVETPVQYAKAGEVEELRKQIATNHDKVFGTFGELRAAIKATAANPSGQTVKVTKDALKSLRAAGYDEIADLLGADLEGLAVANSQGSLDQVTFDKAVDEKVAKATSTLERATEKKLLTLAHPDWSACFHAEDFKVWRATLPAAAQQVIDHGWDSMHLAGALADFKEWRAKAETAKADLAAKATADAAAAEAAKERDKRLEGAITPEGGGAASGAPNEDDAFLNAFKNARGGG